MAPDDSVLLCDDIPAAGAIGFERKSGGRWGAVVAGSDDSESTDGDLRRGEGRRMKTTWGMMWPPLEAAEVDDELKKPEVEVVGVDEVVSSLSEMQSGLELPLLLGPTVKTKIKRDSF